MIYISNTMNWITHMFVIGFVMFYFLNQMGLMDNIAITDYDYQETKNLIDICENEHKELIETKIKLNEIKSLDIYRAYEEARQDYRDLRNSRSSLSFFLFLTTFLGIFLTWIITSEYYKNKKTQKRGKNK